MANSAGDARGSELEIRQRAAEAGAVDVMVSVGPNFFYTVTLPCTLWFLDRGKSKTKRKDKVLFIDARHIFTQIDRAHREFTPEQIEFIANIVRLYRGEKTELPRRRRHQDWTKQRKFPKGKYADVLGCARSPRSPRLRRRVGALIRGVTWAWPRGQPMTSSSRCGWKNSTKNWKFSICEARELEATVAGNVASLLWSGRIL